MTEFEQAVIDRLDKQNEILTALLDNMCILIEENRALNSNSGFTNVERWD